MSLFDKVRAAFSGGSSTSQARQLYEFAVQCRRCGDVLPAYVNLQNDLSQDYERDVWFVRKLISGSGANGAFNRLKCNLRSTPTKSSSSAKSPAVLSSMTLCPVPT